MSWVCPNCSNPNEDSKSECLVCGCPRTRVEEEAAIDCKVVYSTFSDMAESLKNLFSAKPKPKVDKPKKIKPAKKPKEESSSDSGTSKSKRKVFGSSDFATPWPEHNIKFDTSAIKEKGYVRSERQTLGGVNGYTFYREDGTSQFIRVEMVLIQKMAQKK